MVWVLAGDFRVVERSHPRIDLKGGVLLLLAAAAFGGFCAGVHYLAGLRAVLLSGDWQIYLFDYLLLDFKYLKTLIKVYHRPATSC